MSLLVVLPEERDKPVLNVVTSIRNLFRKKDTYGGSGLYTLSRLVRIPVLKDGTVIIAPGTRAEIFLRRAMWKLQFPERLPHVPNKDTPRANVALSVIKLQNRW
jgi:hypothetical protein